MKRFKLLFILLFASLVLNVYFVAAYFGFKPGGLAAKLHDTGIIYEQQCPQSVTNSRICSIEVLQKRNDFAMLRVHYHYVKGDEATNRIVVKANKGSHDNVIGTNAAFELTEGDNTIDIPFGMYRAGEYNEAQPYESKFIMVEARGITADHKHYTEPDIFKLFAVYDHSWYTEGEKPSWQ